MASTRTISMMIDYINSFDILGGSKNIGIILNNRFVIVYSTKATADEKYIFDFTKYDGINAWQEQSDTVRDVGMSKATIVLHENKEFRRAIFFALLNPQLNGAGFAGIRAIGNYNLTGKNKLQIHCRGQGQYNGYKVVLRHKGLNEEPSYSFEQYFQVSQRNINRPFEKKEDLIEFFSYTVP